MVTASQAFDLNLPRAHEAEGVGDPFGPSVPLVWWYGRLRYADSPATYRLTRWRERLRRFWYDTWKQPAVSEDVRRMFPDDRAVRGSYAEARSLCRTSNCYVRALPFGQTPFGDELFDNPTFIRPQIEPARDRQFAATYTKTLEDFLCPELQERVRQLTRALEVQTVKMRSALEEDEHD
jgi:hypothetical protein